MILSIRQYFVAKRIKGELASNVHHQLVVRQLINDYTHELHRLQGEHAVLTHKLGTL